AFPLGFRAMYLWLRPYAQRVRQTPPERSRAERLVHEHGADSLAFFALRRDKSYFFSPTGRSFLAYRVVTGCALVTGDPIGARAAAGARLHDGDGLDLRLRGGDARGRRGAGRAGRRLPAARPVASERRLVARGDAPARRDAERPDGVPDRADTRLGPRAWRGR